MTNPTFQDARDGRIFQMARPIGHLREGERVRIVGTAMPGQSLAVASLESPGVVVYIGGADSLRWTESDRPKGTDQR